MSNKRGIRFHRAVCPSLSLVALIWLSGPGIGDEVKGGAAVKVQDRNRGSTPEVIYAYGTTAPVSFVQSTLSFQRDGMIADIYVKEGDRFKKGDNLLRLPDGEIATAEFDGVVTGISVNKGDHFSAGAPLLTLSYFDRLILVVGVEAPALSKIKPDQPVHLTPLSSDFTPLSDCKPSESKVKRIGIAVDPKTRQVPVFIELPDGMAGCGENFKAEIEVGNSGR